MRTLAILGSTGSIGTQALDVVRHHPDFLRVEALSARNSVELLARQVREFRPRIVHVAEAEAARRLETLLGADCPTVLTGGDGLIRLAEETQAEMIVVATVGWTGVEPTLAAIASGHQIALANKEVLVCAGNLVMAASQRHDVTIWPLDSEHNAIMQCLAAGPAGPRAPLRRVILTCSGGPFRNASREEIDAAGPERTLAHPTWDMGRKVTVDSATLMNKGFEVIEAHHLFGIAMDKIEVVIHPQSIVHSMVEFIDGSMIAQMGVADMRLPIQNVLTQPYRRPAPVAPLSLPEAGVLEFSAPDMERFPCLHMAYEAARQGGTVPCVLNAANEVAVAAHLADQIPCGSIPRVIESVLDRHDNVAHPDLETLRQADSWARAAASKELERIAAAAR